MVLAALVSLFIQWTRGIFGATPALVTFALLLTAPWLTVFARNLYWVTWTWFLPFFVFLWLGGKPECWTKRGLVYAFVLSVVLGIIKSSTGYEYLSTVSLAAAAPIVFYAIYPVGRRLLDVVSRIMLTGAGFAIGFLVTLAIHLSMLAGQVGGFGQAWVVFHKVFTKRMGGNAGALPEFRESFEANLFSLLRIYLDSKYVFFGLSALGLIVFSILGALLVGVKIRNGEIPRDKLPALKGLGAALIVGFLAPISWFVLAKPHSYYHGHMNFVVWYLPFGLLAATGMGILLDEFLQSVVGARKALPAVVGILTAAALLFVIQCEKVYRRIGDVCWGRDASVSRHDGAAFSSNPLRKDVCFRYSSFDVFSDGDLNVRYRRADNTLGIERMRIAEDYLRLPAWRGRDVVIVRRWPEDAVVPVALERLKSDGTARDEWRLAQAP
jgi:hypothetical protein